MLAYLRDANQPPAAEQMQQQTAETGGQSGALGAGEYFRPAVHARNVRQGTIVLVILFAAGAAGVWDDKNGSFPGPRRPRGGLAD